MLVVCLIGLFRDFEESNAVLTAPDFVENRSIVCAAKARFDASEKLSS